MTAVALHASNSGEGSVSVWARAKRPRSNQLAEIILMSSAEAGLSSTYFVAAAIAMIRRAVDSNRRGAGRVCPCDVGTTQTGALRDAATRGPRMGGVLSLTKSTARPVCHSPAIPQLYCTDPVTVTTIPAINRCRRGAFLLWSPFDGPEHPHGPPSALND